MKMKMLQQIHKNNNMWLWLQHECTHSTQVYVCAILMRFLSSSATGKSFAIGTKRY